MNHGRTPAWAQRKSPPKPQTASNPAPRPESGGASPSMLECWRVPRVAKLLDVSKKRVYQLVQEGRLEAIRLGPRQMRILKGSVERYIGRLMREEAERDL